MYNKKETAYTKTYFVVTDDEKIKYRLNKNAKTPTNRERIDGVNLFVKTIASCGKLDSILTEKERKIAIKKGILPKKFNVHHYVPLSIGGKNDSSNMCVIEKRLHKWLHAYLLDPIYRDIKLDPSLKKVYLELPVKKDFYILSDAGLFFSTAELQQIELDEKNGCVPVYQWQGSFLKEMVSSMRFMEQLKRDIPFCDSEDVREKSEKILQVIQSKIRAKNTKYRHKKLQLEKLKKDKETGKTKHPLSRREKAELHFQKAKKVSSNRWYPHEVVRSLQQDDLQR